MIQIGMILDLVMVQTLGPTKGTSFITFHGDLPYSSQENIEKLDLIDEDDSGSGGLVVIQIWGKIFIS
ncbi:phosducin-like protein 3 [Iris pallida]|uniref:Phosducin-like protein 3 n=1 Tax=Iris pallida TaxID=29817 RepID=A0AAX6F0R2_IRIPA|nr:phosducin-like protein 3 [Iris pallida]